MKANELWCGGCGKFKFAGLPACLRKRRRSGLGSFVVGSKVEHKTEHNNCRMRG
jgi:hypothetical protein